MITTALIIIIALLVFLLFAVATLIRVADQILRLIARELTERAQKDMTPTERIFNA